MAGPIRRIPLCAAAGVANLELIDELGLRGEMPARFGAYLNAGLR